MLPDPVTLISLLLHWIRKNNVLLLLDLNGKKYIFYIFLWQIIGTYFKQHVHIT